MSNTFLVPRGFYRRLQHAPPGQEVPFGTDVHAHGKTFGACEVVHRGAKPIRCIVKRTPAEPGGKGVIVFCKL